jgi:hypothetical protein
MALTIPQALKRIDQIMNQVQDQFVEEGSRTVRSKTPVRTGKLQNGWNTKSAPFGRQASIDNNVQYANYVENGSPTVRPYKMAAQTVQTLRSQADSIVRKAVK